MKEAISVLTIMTMYLISSLFVQEMIGEWVNLYCLAMTSIIVFVVFPCITKTRD